MAQGKHHFTLEDAVRATGASVIATRAAIRRLRLRGRLAAPMRGFHLIIPPEYRALGCLPAEQFVPQLLEAQGIAHYVGLLSAPAYHGAAHQAPMTFQVVVARERPGIRCGTVSVEFVNRRNAADIPTRRFNTPRGYLHVSTPEATAIDLVGYPGRSGGLPHAATVLAELAERMDPEKLVAVLPLSPVPWCQRLGHLLDRAGARALSDRIADHVARHVRDFTPLDPGAPKDGASRDRRFKVLVNADAEADL